MNGDEIHRHFHRIFMANHRNNFISNQFHQNPNKIGTFQTYQQKNEYEKITILPTPKCL